MTPAPLTRLTRAALVLLLACGSGGVNVGTVKGTPIVVRDSQFNELTSPAGSGAQVFLTDAPWCASLATPFSLKNGTILDFVLMNRDDGGTFLPLAAGDYRVIARTSLEGGLVASVHLSKHDENCRNTLAVTSFDATDGHVTVTERTSATIAGSFDVKFGPDQLAGDFRSTVCMRLPSMDFVCR